MAGGFLGGLADDRHVQASADYAGDLSERNAFFRDRVIPGSRGSFLKREPIEMSDIEPVYSRPPVVSFPYKC